MPYAYQSAYFSHLGATKLQIENNPRLEIAYGELTLTMFSCLSYQKIEFLKADATNQLNSTITTRNKQVLINS